NERPVLRPVAQQCNIKSQNVLSRYPDQFAPFLNLPLGLRAALQHGGHYYGTVLRLPFRQQPSSLAHNVWQSTWRESIERVLQSALESAMMFSRHVGHSTLF